MPENRKIPEWVYKESKPTSDSEYFENMSRCIFQAGLSWQLVANKWSNFRVAFNEFNIPKVAWLGDRRFAMLSVIIMSAWKTLGFMMVLFLAGLQNIPNMFYEAAEIEGAGSWKKFRYITFPLLSPTTFFIIVISIIGSFKAFDIIYIMTQGGPALATSTIVMLCFS